MALFPLNPGIMPLGQYDCLDADLASVTGGEVMALASVAAASDEGAADAEDGYTLNGLRAAARLALAGDVDAMLALADDGTAGYGTMFGETIGTPVGQSATGTNLGPHTAAASGKVTLWDKPGLYAVSVTSLATDFVSGGGPALAPGASLGYNADAKLAHTGCAGAVASSGVATFVEFAPSPSLVNTPAKLSGATATFAKLYPRIVVAFHAGHGARAL